MTCATKDKIMITASEFVTMLGIFPLWGAMQNHIAGDMHERNVALAVLGMMLVFAWIAAVKW